MPNVKKDLAVIFIGHGSEYVFGQLASHLRQREFHCFELNMANIGWRDEALRAIDCSDRILFTSQHPYVNRRAWQQHYGYSEDIVDLPEALELLHPDQVFYVPHDLSCPIKHEEIIGLSYVDAALMPDDTYWCLGGLTKIYNAGWIGSLSAEDDRSASERPSIAFLPSEIGYYKAVGLERFLDIFDEILKMDIVVKLPVLDGVDVLERGLLDRGVKVLPSAGPACEIICNSTIVVSNGLSSVIAEAVLHGKRAICLLDEVHEDAVQREFFASTKTPILFCEPNAVRAAIESISSTANIPVPNHAKAFDLDLVIKLIGC